ncbi:MAG: ABC transporter ATP-binding protein [Euryarchaeota archaeon]|nr:ABC transporter ATP-binding protein [Euryarchaeota archaeon]
MNSPWVALEGLRAGYPGFELGPVDLSMGRREVVVVVGPSGSGKTTLLRCLAGLARNSGGRLLWEGRDVTSTSPEHRNVGYVPQGLSLFPHRTVEQNVGFAKETLGAPTPDREVRALLERFELTSLARRRPHELSGGQRQRVAMARALAAHPRLLLWDEPLSGLDVLARDDLVQMMLEVTSQQDVALLLVTHDPSVAFSVADRFLLLHGGSVRFLGDPEHLMSSPCDAFSARFAGYENVLSTQDLAAASGAPWARPWLDRAGPEGIACSAERLSFVQEEGRGRLPAVVRWVHRDPLGWRVGLECGPWRLEQHLRPPLAPPEVRQRGWVEVDERHLLPLRGLEEGRGS